MSKNKTPKSQKNSDDNQDDYFAIDIFNQNTQNDDVDIFGNKIQQNVEFGTQTSSSPVVDMFGNNISQDVQFGVQRSFGEDVSPSIKDMINKLELAVKSNKFDEETSNLYQQISSFVTLERISQISPILNAPTLTSIRDKSLTFIQEQKDLQNSTQLNNPDKSPNDKHPILSTQEIKTMQAEFLESRNDYQKNIEDINQFNSENINQVNSKHLNKD